MEWKGKLRGGGRRTWGRVEW